MKDIYILKEGTVVTVRKTGHILKFAKHKWHWHLSKGHKNLFQKRFLVQDLLDTSMVLKWNYWDWNKHISYRRKTIELAVKISPFRRWLHLSLPGNWATAVNFSRLPWHHLWDKELVLLNRVVTKIQWDEGSRNDVTTAERLRKGRRCLYRNILRLQDGELSVHVFL